MDFLTHFFLPFTAALFVLGLHRRPATGPFDQASREDRIALAVVFGLAGFSPDIDPLFSWASHHGGLYWLQHRGITHTLVFAPFFALAVVGVLHAVAVRWPRRLGRYRFRPLYVPVAVGGAWSHLVLDMVTYSGVPLLWPFAFGRVGLDLFHWIVLWIFPLVLLILGVHLFGRLKVHHVAWFGLMVVVILVVLGSVRLHYQPVEEPLADGSVTVFPRSSIFEWTVVQCDRGSTSCTAQLVRSGVPQGSVMRFEGHVAPGAQEAVEQAKQDPAYRGFQMGVLGPVVVRAEPIDEEGTVAVNFTDVAARFEALNDPRWTPTDPYEAWGYALFHVVDEEVRVIHRGW